MADGTFLCRGAKSRTDPRASSRVTRDVRGNDSTTFKADEDDMAVAAGSAFLAPRQLRNEDQYDTTNVVK
jgi:hypothetical protein